METKVQRWGNSLAVRIPSSFVKEMGVSDGSSLEISLENGAVVLKSVVKYSLDELLEGMTEKNIHPETLTGKPKGKEVW